ncbi:hypothetical protein DPMN_065951 [Dreissena polymorpha]|uniref:Globin domain-containing protein n=1 Tax=Dreissena polymorpha TaxID=45954 RepID=A0A9D4BSG3_DREPO|nr:hypothetical protein DPMN_065951 [Dreissena polymorpha]
MGCKVSTIANAKSSCKMMLEPYPNTNRTSALNSAFDESRIKEEISQEDMVIVRRTWPYLCKNLQDNGLQVFLRIFEIAPEIKHLFHVENVRHTELIKNATIKGHASRFMNAIGAAVDNLDDLDSRFAKLLITLGEQHTNYTGFKVEYFETFYEAMMWQWERCLGSMFTFDVAKTWSHVFAYIMVKLQQGYYSVRKGLESKGTMATVVRVISRHTLKTSA